MMRWVIIRFSLKKKSKMKKHISQRYFYQISWESKWIEFKIQSDTGSKKVSGFRNKKNGSARSSFLLPFLVQFCFGQP